MLPQIRSNDIGLELLVDCLSLSLKIGITLASFHESGYKDVSRIFSKIILSGIPTEASQKISIWPNIPSEPEAFLEFKFLTNEIITSFLIDIWSILLSVRKLNIGNTLLLVISIN